MYDFDRKRISLPQALKKYWFHYLGLIVFLPALSWLETYKSDKSTLSFADMILFFSVGIYAGWPVTRKDAPYTFCITAGLIWLVSAVFWTLVGIQIGGN